MANSPARRVWLFGGIRAEDEHGRLTLPSGNIQYLFTYLLLHPQTTHTREQLAQILWPDAAPTHLKRPFTNLLYRFRKSVGDHWLLSEGETISLQKDELWVDVWEFEHLLQRNTPTDLKQAVTLYAGDICPEIYADWIVPRRVLFRERFLAALARLAETAEKEVDLDTALTHYHRLLQFDPLSEMATRGLMRLYARQGQLDTAVAHYERLHQALDQELRTAPGPQTHRLFQSIQGQSQTQPQHVAPPFVGRVPERSRLLSRLDKAQEGGGGLALVLGESGMGKTRLLTEIADAAQWRGWQISWGYAQEFTLPPAFAPLRQALQTLCPPSRLHQLSQLVPAYWLANAAPVLPNIAATLGHTAPNQQKGQLASALGHLLQGLGQIAPHLILLDDIQWADPGLWELLTELHPFLAEANIFMVLNGRTEELRANANVWQTVTAWDRVTIPVIHLPRLSRDELQVLTGQQLAPAQLEQLNTASGGNPLLALTLLEMNDLEGTPATLDALLRRRLQLLSTPAQLALQAAAVIGRSFDYLLWQQVVTAVSATDLPLLAGELEQASLIHLQKDGYQFAHDTLRAYVYTNAPAARRRMLHQRALAALQQADSQDPLTLLYHAQKAKADTAVGHYALQAGEQALESLAYQNALAYFNLALTHLPDQEWSKRFRATRGQVKAIAALGNPDARDKATLSLLALAEHLADPHYQAEAAYYRADHLWQTGQQDAAYSQAQTGLEIAQQANDAANQAPLLVSLGRIAHNRGDFKQAIRWLEQAQAQFQQLEDTFGAADTLDKLANLTYQSGQYPQAAHLHTQAAEAFQSLNNPLKEARALNGLALAIRAQGDYTKGQQIHEQAFHIGEKLGDAELQWVQLVNLGNIAYELGNAETAVTRYEAAIHIIRQINDPYALAVTILNLGEIHLDNDQVQQARHHYAEALALNQEHGYERGVALAQHGLGLTWLAEENIHEAKRAFYAAQTVWLELNQPLKRLETEAGLALACLVAGEMDAAKQHCQTALKLLDDAGNQTTVWRQVHFTAYRVFADDPAKALHHLRLAGTAVQNQANKLPEERRHPFLQKVSLNRQIMTAVAQHSQQQSVRLVRDDVPLGRKLTEADYVEITWTVASPLDDAVANPVQRRRAVLLRLLQEAAAQSAAPSDDDLATALGVSRRTIERDMAALRDKDIPPTRRRN